MFAATPRRSLDDLIALSEPDAVKAAFDDRNRAVLFRFLTVFTLGSVAALLILAADGQYWAMGAAGASLVMARLLHSLDERPILDRHFRALLLGWLLVQFVLIRLPTIELVYHPFDTLLPILLLFFRLTGGQLAALLGLWWSLSAGRDLVMSTLNQGAVNLPALLGITLLGVAVFSIGSALTKRRRREFVSGWRREHQRHRERLRMREELDDARRIQLSMLPRSDPASPWLDMAGISIPASEVGGDYYEYFRVDESRQAVVVADVAGHGVASGLLLAGVRSCLYLLKEMPQRPRDVLSKLDRVVRETTGRRQFVTMLYALFDRERKRLTLSAAGHPPLLRYVAATGEVEEVGPHALPLGTALVQDIQEIEVPFDSDDIFLAVTDGIAETVNSRGEVYGAGRLAERLRSTAHDRGAKEIRDTLLGDVWSFKADGEQTDDITLVVVKIR
ncbi:MAG: PP2C family protein-serine/threonine phosphatase [Acidobacteriota bacterium]